MANERLFDIEREPQRIRDRYGPTLFGQQAPGGSSAVRGGRAVRPRRPGLVG